MLCATRAHAADDASSTVSPSPRNLQHQLLQVHILCHHVLTIAPHWSSSMLVSRTKSPTQRRLLGHPDHPWQLIMSLWSKTLGRTLRLMATTIVCSIWRMKMPSRLSLMLRITLEHKHDDGPRHRGREYRGTTTSAGTTQEAKDRNVLRLSPECKTWLLLQHIINDLSKCASSTTTIRCKNAAWSCFVASDFRGKEDFYLEAFLKHRDVNLLSLQRQPQTGQILSVTGLEHVHPQCRRHWVRSLALKSYHGSR